MFPSCFHCHSPSLPSTGVTFLALQVCDLLPFGPELPLCLCYLVLLSALE